jgi:hypothetical protein
MSLLSKLTLGAVAVLGVYALKPRRTSAAARAGSVAAPRTAHKAAAGATKRKRSAKPAKTAAGSPKARTRNRPARGTRARRAS